MATPYTLYTLWPNLYLWSFILRPIYTKPTFYSTTGNTRSTRSRPQWRRRSFRVGFCPL